MATKDAPTARNAPTNSRSSSGSLNGGRMARRSVRLGLNMKVGSVPRAGLIYRRLRRDLEEKPTAKPVEA